MPDGQKGDDVLLTLHVQVALLHVIVILVPCEILQIKRGHMANYCQTHEACAQI